MLLENTVPVKAADQRNRATKQMSITFHFFKRVVQFCLREIDTEHMSITFYCISSVVPFI